MSTYLQSDVLGKVNQFRRVLDVISQDFVDLLHGVHKWTSEFVSLTYRFR